MKALVIGGTGPSGPYMVRGLVSRGYKVTILHRGAHEIPLPDEVDHIHGDAHFQAPGDIVEALKGQTFDVVIATYGRLRRIAEAMKGRTQRFIAIGGTPAYKGWRKPALAPEGLPTPVREDTTTLHDNPDLDLYGYLIVMTERTIMENHRAGHYQATIFRYPQIYGPWQPGPRDWSIVRRILDGRKRFILPDGGLTIETWCYGENAAHAVLLAVDQPDRSVGQIYHVGDESPMSLRRRVHIISRIMGHEWELVEIPRALAPPTFPYLTHGSHHRILDLTKIKTELGYRDVVPAEEGVEKTVRWLQENRPAPRGQEEMQLKDPFDYAAEDRFIEAFQECIRRMALVPWTPWEPGLSRYAVLPDVPRASP